MKRTPAETALRTCCAERTRAMQPACMYALYALCVHQTIVNDIRNFVFGLAGATVYGSCKSWKQKFVMSFTISHNIVSSRSASVRLLSSNRFAPSWYASATNPKMARIKNAIGTNGASLIKSIGSR